MLDLLRDRIAAYLAAHRWCALSAAGSEEVATLPCPYQARGLCLDCLLPALVRGNLSTNAG